ncbi:unnamed protein product, partial [Prorocentrum cordatum]
YGISEGSPSMASIERTASQALIEVTMALNNGSTSSDLEFGAIGHSIGCAAALRLATALQTTTPLRHVALCAPFTSLPEVAKVLLPILKIVPTWLIATLTSRNAWDNMAEVSHLARNPAKAPRVDVIHGTRDEICPQDHGVALEGRMKSLQLASTFRSVKAGHNDILGTKAFAEWLEKKVHMADA